MKKEQFFKPATLRFSHFTRKRYALFATLGKVVIIGVLAVSTLRYAKAAGVSTHEEVARDTLVNAEMGIDEVVVTGSRVPHSLLDAPQMVEVMTRDDINHQPATVSVNDVLKHTPGLDVRQRGAYGVQTDISLRGGNFDQTTFLLNGINFSSPHTGHLSADFPLSTDDIERIELLSGPAARIYGPSAFNGVINLITRKNTDFLTAHLSAGSYGYVNANANVNRHTRHFNNFLSAGFSRSDGAVENSAFSSVRAFYQGAAYWGDQSLTMQLSYSYKPFEANTFYGAGSTDQWEMNARLSGAITGDFLLGPIHIAPQLYWNRWYDHYQWHHNDPAGENYHRVTAAGESITAWTETLLGKTSLGAEFRQERIWSTSLGLPTESPHHRYTHHDGRNITSIFLNHDILLRQLSISLGLTTIHTPLDGWGAYPGVDLSYRIGRVLTLYASWNMAMRMPTFTDLYYSGANIEGNSNLLSERTYDAQVGLRVNHPILLADLQLFYSHKRNMIDWVTSRDFNDDMFHSVNFTMDNFGAEVNLTLQMRHLLSERFPIRNISVKYAYIHERSHYAVEVEQSKYAMDYLRNSLILSADGRIWNKLNLSLSWRLNDRVGEGNPDYALLDARLSWDARKYSLYIEGDNILNKRYYDYVTIPQPRFTFVGGVRLTL